jgi:hypothetical protein
MTEYPFLLAHNSLYLSLSNISSGDTVSSVIENYNLYENI